MGASIASSRLRIKVYKPAPTLEMLRTSTRDACRLRARFDAGPSLNLQRDALKKVGRKRVFTDGAGGAGAERPGLAKTLEFVRLPKWRG